MQSVSNDSIIAKLLGSWVNLFWLRIRVFNPRKEEISSSVTYLRQFFATFKCRKWCRESNTRPNFFIWFLLRSALSRRMQNAIFLGISHKRLELRSRIVRYERVSWLSIDGGISARPRLLIFRNFWLRSEFAWEREAMWRFFTFIGIELTRIC